MCNNTNEVKEYINYQTGEKLDLEKVSQLKDNAMLKVKPELWIEWDFEKNDELGFNIWEMTKGNGKIKAHWRCLNNNHPYDASPYQKTKGGGCPICSSHRLLIGFNDMWTTNPQLAKLLANPDDDGYRYMQFSNVKVDWKCGCGELIKSRKITDVNGQGLHCKKCADGVSFPEKLMFYLFKEIGIEFKSEKIFNWSYNKRYDFYFVHNNQKILIETHGRQHYIQTSRKGARTLEEEQENDKYKYEMAVANGIDPENYIVIDCRYSEFEYIKDNILNSRLAKLFDLSNVDWLSIRIKSQSSNKLEILKLHNDGVNGKDIANKMGLNRTTVYSTLKNYGVNISNTITKERHCIKVYQLDTNMNLIRIWNSFQEIEDILGYAKSGIKKNCLNLTGLSRGYKWMFKEDYDKYLNGDLSYIVKKKNTKATPLVQFDLNGILIKEWDNIISASEALNINKYNLKRALNGNSKISGGFKWMYKEDYDKYIEEQNKSKLA